MLTLPKPDFHAIGISPQNSIFFTLTVEKKIFISAFIHFVRKNIFQLIRIHVQPGICKNDAFVKKRVLNYFLFHNRCLWQKQS